MRINKYLSLCGVASRRNAETLITEGRIAVNGVVVTELFTRVGETDVVTLDGMPLQTPKQYTVLMFHKPPGCVCTAYDPQGRSTVYDYLPPGFRSLKYVGRLDLQSRGLLLFSDDGELVHRMTHPSYQVPRSYLVWTNHPLNKRDVQSLLQGVDIGEGEIGKAMDVRLENGFIELTLTEGKNREIRRMMEALGLRIEDLKRVSWGPMTLGDLPAGDFRELSPEEVASLCDLVELGE
jgi:23S rRNA pseudouridine2605 synthase